MTKLTTTLVIAIAAIGLSLGGCKKKDKETPAAGSGSTMTGTGSAGSGSAAGSMGSGSAAGSMGSGAGSMAAGSGSGSMVADPVPAVAADYIKVTADHVDPAKGKVDVVFSKWAVTKASFDPANLEGGTAELEIDAASLSSGIADRDTHLNTPDFLDSTKFPKVNVKVDNVKKAGDKSYTADANISLHGVEKKLPVKFDVVASTADSVTIKTNTPFSRKDFSVGGDGGPKDTVKFDLILDAQLTLKKM